MTRVMLQKKGRQSYERGEKTSVSRRDRNVPDPGSNLCILLHGAVLFDYSIAQVNAATKLVKEYKKRQSSIGYAGACQIESDWREVCYLLFLP